MIRYQRLVQGEVKNEWLSDFADENYTEPGWGSPSTYTITSTDITQELLDDKNKTDAYKLSKDFIKTLDISKVKTLTDATKVLEELVKIVNFILNQ